MRIWVRESAFFLRNLTLRVPFRYGIATMTHVPHLVTRLRVEVDGVSQFGYSADNLPPKWFTKNAEAPFRDEIEEMIAVAVQASEFAKELPPSESVFGLWRALWQAQETWAVTRGLPPLLYGFGVSLVERAVIDAVCRVTKIPFHRAVRDNLLGIDLTTVHPELAGLSPATLLPAAVVRTTRVRHTIGLADPVDEDDSAHGHVADGLPVSVEEFIRAQGLTHFKIKLSGDVERDRQRLARLAGVFTRHTDNYRFTLDGNENFLAVEPFRALWEALRNDHSLRPFMDRLLFVEQPFHRSVALAESTRRELLAWSDRPHIIIDESDATCEALPLALSGGYCGTSHKNCKGVIHGLVSACLIGKRRRDEPHRRFELSSEDLTNLGPIALLQDLAVVATLGLDHAERNGHHYFAGLSQFPASVQRGILRSHGDLYALHPAGFPIVEIRDGALQMASVVDAPFGLGFEPNLEEFTPLETWTYASLEALSAG